MLNILCGFFIFLLCVSSLCVVLFHNPFFSLLFLILSFLLTAVLFLILECEFFALIILIIYVGAVAILVLFMLMMLETKLKNLFKNVVLYFPFGVFINGLFLFELIKVISKCFDKNPLRQSGFDNNIFFQQSDVDPIMDIEAIGQILYNHFVLQFIIVGLILFVSLVGVIYLTSAYYNTASFTNSSISLSKTARNVLAQQQNGLSLIFGYVELHELTSLPEYFFITFLFCVTLFMLLFSKITSQNKMFLQRFPYDTSLSSLVILGLIFYFILLSQQIDLSLLNTSSFTSTIRNDLLSLMAKSVICFFSILYVFFITKYLKYRKLSNLEYYILLINSMLGFFLLCESNDLITAYLAIELQGLSFYVLASFKKSSSFSIESGIKYFVLGSFSTAMFLFGTSLVYGLSGSVIHMDFQNLFFWALSSESLFSVLDISKDYNQYISTTSLTDSSLSLNYEEELNQTHVFFNKGIILGLLFIVFALFFKLVLAPFYLWAPDVYEGSPSSSTFFFMVISKFSFFVFLVRLCYSGFYSMIAYWQFYALIVATFSTFIGAFVGLKQRKLKSLLTYSSIGNMGFVLLSFSLGGFEGIQVHLYYLMIYMFSGLCIWSIVLNLRLKTKLYNLKFAKDLGDFVLLQESNPITAQNLAIPLFTLAGLPPIIGFIVKMNIFKSLIGISIYFFSLINILFSAISTFYYLRMVKIIFFENTTVGKLYKPFDTGTTLLFLNNLMSFFLIFMFVSPMLVYFYSYKLVLVLNYVLY
nr:NADH dehydrogenase subunit 6/2 [Haslea karadagensis]